MKVTIEGALAPTMPVVTVDVSEAPSASEAATPSRAVVPIKPVETDKSLTLPARRGSAPFLAQLIATERALPQTRERRRAAPREALAAYGEAAARVKRRA